MNKDFLEQQEWLAKEFHSTESFKELQNDFISEPARTLLPLMGKELWFQYDNKDPMTLMKSRPVV